MQTKPLPNTPHARIPPPPNLPEMFHLEEVLDFPAQEAHVVGLAKSAFSGRLGFLIKLLQEHFAQFSEDFAPNSLGVRFSLLCLRLSRFAVFCSK
jgi:hypothetical protein